MSEAELRLRQDIANAPADAGLLRQLSTLLDGEQRHDDALAAALQACALDPTDASLSAWLATLQLQVGHFDDAARTIASALSREPDRPDFHNIMSVACERQGRAEDAFHHAGEARRLDPANVDFIFHHGVTAGEAGHGDVAAAALREALALRADAPHYYLTLARVLEQREQFDQAVELLTSALPHIADPASFRREIREVSQRREAYELTTEKPPSRYGFASIIDATVAPASTSSPLAVLVRTHTCDAKYFDLMAKLERTHGRAFDFYAIVDRTNGEPDPGPWPVIWHSVAETRKLGLTQKQTHLLHRCGDIPLYFALRSIPQYGHYLMIEDDVDFVGDDASFLSELLDATFASSRGEIDFAGLFFKHHPNDVWAPPAITAYSKAYAYYATFPVVLVSRRLTSFLLAQRQLEAARGTPTDDIIACEAFAPSAAMAGGFRCVDLNDLVPGCYDTTIMLHHGPGGVGHPLGLPFRSENSVRMYHPVYTAPAFVSRLRSKLGTGAGNLEEMAPAIEAVVDHPVMQPYHAQIRAILSGA